MPLKQTLQPFGTKTQPPSVPPSLSCLFCCFAQLPWLGAHLASLFLQVCSLPAAPKALIVSKQPPALSLIPVLSLGIMSFAGGVVLVSLYYLCPSMKLPVGRALPSSPVPAHLTEAATWKLFKNRGVPSGDRSLGLRFSGAGWLREQLSRGLMGQPSLSLVLKFSKSHFHPWDPIEKMGEWLATSCWEKNDSQGVTPGLLF